MIKGLDKFQEHFKENRDSYVLIGGVACHEWLDSQGLPFRATKDIDIVLIVEALGQSFVERFWQFIEAGQYEIRERAQGDRELYRFSKPKNDGYPVMIEVFSRKPGNIELGAGQHIVPVAVEDLATSLSAILLDDEYYKLIVDHRVQDADGPFVHPVALIPLKARAWIDLTKRKAEGQKVDDRDIDKHRADVFRIAATLPGEAGPDIGNTVSSDLKTFLNAFPIDSPEWPAILTSLKTTFGSTPLKVEALIEAIRTYFKL